MLETPSYAPPPLSLSFPLFLCFPLFSIFFLGFRHLIFSSSSQSFYTSGFQAFIVLISPFEIDWLKSQLEVAASAIGFSVLYLLLHSSRSIAAFNGASACVNIVFSPLITCPWTWLKSKNICAHSPRQPACPFLTVSPCPAFRETCVCISFTKRGHSTPRV